VATRVGGIPEFVEAGVNGTLIEPESVEQLFAGIKLYADDAALVERIGSANRAAAANLGVAQMADRYERVYRSILGSSAP
jgi:glycosyltransferase involved in cell wall biosynthesis